MPTGSVTPSHSAAHHLEQVAAEVAVLAAVLVRGSVGRAAAAGTKSSPTDVVTETDVESERLIRRELLDRCPGSAIAGEELDDQDGANTVSWVVDPIDGTVNFLYDLPVVSVSIAACIDGITVAGAVADIVRGDVFSASQGAGARRNGVAVSARPTTSLEQSLVGTGFSYSAQRRQEQSSILNRLLPAARDIRCMGSAALNLCWVACGRLDAYYEHDTKLYDYAAGALIATEAGARVELPADTQLDLSIAAAAGVFDRLRSIVVSG
ncbi:MAG: inositol monophosphatase family protein [Ilumatobacter sp.]